MIFDCSRETGSFDSNRLLCSSKLYSLWSVELSVKPLQRVFMFALQQTFKNSTTTPQPWGLIYHLTSRLSQTPPSNPPTLPNHLLHHLSPFLPLSLSISPPPPGGPIIIARCRSPLRQLLMRLQLSIPPIHRRVPATAFGVKACGPSAERSIAGWGHRATYRDIEFWA